MTDISFERSARPPPIGTDRGPMLVAGGGLAVGFLVIAGLVDLRQATLFVIGGLLGVALYHGSFGFTGAGARGYRLGLRQARRDPRLRRG